MQSQQAQDFLDDLGDSVSRYERQPEPRLLGVGRLDADDEGHRRQHPQTQGDHQGTRGGREVHVRELVPTSVDRQSTDVEHVRTLYDDAARGATEVDGINNEQHVRPAAHQLLHKVDATDADLEHPYSGRQVTVQQRLRNGGADTIVSPQHIAEAGHHRIHAKRVGR